MVPCSLTEVLKDQMLPSASAPSLTGPPLSLQKDVCRPENAPCTRMTPDPCCLAAAEMCRTVLQRVLMSLSMSSTESEDSVSYPSSSRGRLQGLSEGLPSGGGVCSLSVTVTSS